MSILMCFSPPLFIFIVFNVFVLFLILMGSPIKYREIRLVMGLGGVAVMDPVQYRV